VRIAFLLAFLFLFTLPCFGQFTGIQNIIRAGKEDAATLTREYFRPLASGLGASVNAGWTGPIDTTKGLQFSFQLRGSFAIIPPSQKSFDLSNLSLNKVQPANPDYNRAPTLSGSSEAPDILIIDNGVEVAQVTMPKGSGYGWIPVPQLQFSGNIFRHTRLTARLVPEIPIAGYGRASQVGITTSHQINRYLPNQQLPVALSVLIGYNYLVGKRNFNLDLQPNALPDPTYLGNYSNQKLRVQFNTAVVKLMARKSLQAFDIYGGLGLESSNMQVEINGDYPIPVDGIGGTQTQTITDPISYSQNGENTFSLMVGAAYNWRSLTISSDLVAAHIPVWNIGLEVHL